MTVSARRLLSEKFIADTLTQEVHQLLSLTHLREILEALEDSAAGRSARWLDVHVVGDQGSAKTAFVTLNRLAEAGWVTSKGPKGSRAWVISDRGRRALAYARAGDSIGIDGIEGHQISASARH
jgi:hypothetical protein